MLTVSAKHRRYLCHLFILLPFSVGHKIKLQRIIMPFIYNNTLFTSSNPFRSRSYRGTQAPSSIVRSTISAWFRNSSILITFYANGWAGQIWLGGHGPAVAAVASLEIYSFIWFASRWLMRGFYYYLLVVTNATITVLVQPFLHAMLISYLPGGSKSM